MIKDARIVEVLVAEEDYKFSLSKNDLTPEQLKEALLDANDSEVTFVWIEKWIVSDSHPECRDPSVHELLDDVKVGEEIIAELGDGVLDKNGGIDRGRLAEIVFTPADRVKALTAILHWRVLERAERLIETYERDENAHAIVLDMPLLIEVDWAKKCEKVVFIECELQKR